MLRDDVYEAVLEMLLGNEFTPGQSLSIDSIARDLGVSPTPVREALVQLEHTGLVTREALRGYSVALPLTRSQIEELLDARFVLELAVTERAARRSEEVEPLLRAAHAEHEAVIERLKLGVRSAPGDLDRGNVLEYFRADWAFHEVLLNGSGNRFLAQMASALGSNLHRTRQSIDRGVWDAHEALAEHGAILNAVAAGDVEAAVEAMRSHLEGVRERSMIDITAADDPDNTPED